MLIVLIPFLLLLIFIELIPFLADHAAQREREFMQEGKER